MKPRILTTARLSLPLASAIAALLAAPVARATSYYWDANGALTTAVAPTGIWGTSSFWTTDSLGASATAAYAGDNTSDIYFCAGTLGTTGTVTVSGTQNASSITFDDPVAITLSGGTALNIGGTGVFSGIFVTANAVNTISTAITLNAAATIQNAGTSNQTISGGITGGQNLILNANGTGGLLFTTTTVNNAGTITNSGTNTGTNVITAVGSNVTSLIQNSTGSGLTVTTLNLASPGTTLTANGTKGITVTNQITGTGNVTLNNNTASNALFNIGGSATTGTINNGGTITYSGTGAGNQTFGTVGSAVTGLIQSASNSAAAFTVTNQITGGGNFTLSDNSSSTAALTLTNGFNNTGALTNNGTGGGLVTVGVIGTNVTNVIQNSATSQMTLSGANTYNNTNGYNITAGTLKISNATSFANAAKFTLASGGRLDVGAADADLSKLAVANGGSGVVTGSTLKYSVAQTGAATNGPGTIYGTVELAVTGVSPGYPLDFGTGGTLLNTATSTSTIPLTFSSDFTINSNTAAATYSTGGITSSATAGTQTLILGGSNTGANTISSIIGDGSTGGKVAVEKTGAGNWTLSGANTFTGGLNIQQGTVTATTSASALGGSGTGTVTLGGVAGQAATLMGNTTTYTLNNPITLSSTGGNLTIGNSNNGTLLYGGTVSGTHDLILANNNNSSLTFTKIDITGAITSSGTGAGGVTITTLGANTGSLTLASTGGGAAGLTITNAVTTSGSLLLTNNSTSGVITLTGGANNTGNITNTGTSTGGTTITGAITSNVGSVTQNNVNSALKLSVANAFTGNLYIKAGKVSDSGVVGNFGPTTATIYLGDATVGANATLETSSNATMTANPINVVAGTGTRIIKQQDGTNSNGTLPGAITLNNDLGLQDYSSYTKGLTLSGSISGTGNITFNTPTGGGAYLTLSGTSINNNGTITNTSASTGASTISGPIGSAVLGVTQNSATSKLILSGANTYTSATTITQGTLQLGNAGATGSLSSSSAITNNGTLAFNRTDTYGGTFSNTITGTGGINQAGTGTLTLSGTSTYSGPTVISAGTLSVVNLDYVTAGTYGNHGLGSNLGAPTTTANGTLAIGSGTATGTLKYTGTGETTDRIINSASTTSGAGGQGGATIDQSGTGNLKFTSGLASSGTVVGNKTLTLQGSTAGTGEIAGAIVDSGSQSANVNASLILATNTTAFPQSTLTLQGNTSLIAIGATITGGGIAAGTTITNVTGQVVTLSTPTTGNTGSGAACTIDTFKSGVSSIVVASASNLGVGAAVSGPGIAAGTTITGIVAGVGGATNLTLSQPTTSTIASGTAESFTGGATALTKAGSGTWTLSGANTYTGATIISNGTLALAAGSEASPITVNNGAFLGFKVGTTIASSSSLTLVAGAKIKISGTPVLLSYTLITAAGGITGTPVLDAAITGYDLVKDGNSLKLNYTTGGGSDYTTWASTIPGFTDTDPTHDPDGDGLTNQQEYAFGLNPMSAASVNPIISPLNKATGQFTYTRRTQSLTTLVYSYEYSTTLGGWSPFTPTTTSTNSGNPVEEITVTVPADQLANPKLFIRVLAQ